MIKLFKNIRQNLLNEGKTSKYLKYGLENLSNCPTRDNLWVTTKEKMYISVPLGTQYEKIYSANSYLVPKGTMHLYPQLIATKI